MENSDFECPPNHYCTEPHVRFGPVMAYEVNYTPADWVIADPGRGAVGLVDTTHNNQTPRTPIGYFAAE
jgi:hypothetical protein